MIKKLAFIFISITLFACSDDYVDMQNLEYSEGMSLWWDQKIFGENGRGYIFGFDEKERLENRYELIFDYKINKKKKLIQVFLNNKIDHGKCLEYPRFNENDGLCLSHGSIFIPEEELANKNYKFNVYTKNYVAHSILSVNNDKISLEVLDEDVFSTSVDEIYPTQKNLFYGSVKYLGEENAKLAQQFFAMLKDKGFEPTIVANPPFNLYTDEDGNPILKHTPPDRYNQYFLFKLNKPFSSACGVAASFYKENEVDIYYYTSNGDSAKFSQVDGVSIHNSEE